MYNFYNHRRAQCVYIKERGVEDGGCMNSARQSIPGAPDSVVEDA